jgi:hypothetical protein
MNLDDVLDQPGDVAEERGLDRGDDTYFIPKMPISSTRQSHLPLTSYKPHVRSEDLVSPLPNYQALPPTSILTPPNLLPQPMLTFTPNR